MRLSNSLIRYGPIAQLFHWATVLLVIAQFVLMAMAEDLPSGPDRSQLFMLHKSVGITILALVVLRLAYRLASPVPPFPASRIAWEGRVARATHWLLYALLFAIPLVGWAMSGASGRPVVWFGLVELPQLVGADEALDERLEELHESLATVLAVVAVLHTLAALRHHFVLKDDVLRRMLPGPRR